MNSIKFRQTVFDKEGNPIRFHYWGFIEGEFVQPDLSSSDIDQAQANSKPYIGRKDVQGKEVYQGDVIQSMRPIYKGEKANTAVISWDEKKCMFILNKKLFGEFAIEFQLRYNNLYQVIGNDIQNPELI